MDWQDEYEMSGRFPDTSHPAEALGLLRAGRADVAALISRGEYQDAGSLVRRLFALQQDNTEASVAWEEPIRVLWAIEGLGILSDALRVQLSSGDLQGLSEIVNVIADIAGAIRPAETFEQFASGAVCLHGRYSPTGDCLSFPPCQP
jgi:hypothetical protein